MFAAFIVCTLLRSFGLFSAYELLRTHSVVWTAASVSIVAGGSFVTLQAPFTNGPSLSKLQFQRVALHAGLRAVHVLLHSMKLPPMPLISAQAALCFDVLRELTCSCPSTALGLLLCGPLRTVLLAEYTDWVILGIGAMVCHTQIRLVGGDSVVAVRQTRANGPLPGTTSTGNGIGNPGAESKKHGARNLRSAGQLRSCLRLFPPPEVHIIRIVGAHSECACASSNK